VISGTLAFDTIDLKSLLSPSRRWPDGESGPGEIDTSFATASTSISGCRAHASAGRNPACRRRGHRAQVKNGLAVFDISDASALAACPEQPALRRKLEGTQVEIRLLASDVDGGAFGTAAG